MDMRKQDRIGTVEADDEGRIIHVKKGPTWQGVCFKDWEAFYNHPDQPCYVAEYDETGDIAWTHNSFLALAEWDERIAEYLFETVDWQSPTSLLAEELRNHFIVRCQCCGNLSFSE